MTGSFNNLDELPQRVELAIEQARFVGNEESRLAEIEPVVDVSKEAGAG